MLQTFTHLRILHDKDQNGKYELRHDALASKIYEKITSVEKEVLEIRNFIENAFDNFKKRNVLLSSKDLEYISRYEKSLFLKGDLSEFLKKSKERAFARIRAFRMISTAAGVAFLLIILGLGFYSLKSNSGVRSRKLAFESLLMKNDYPADAWEIANKANNIKKTPIAQKALFESFYSLLEGGPFYDSLGNQLHPEKEIFDFTECNSEILFARFSDDEELIYGYLADTSIKIWDKKGHDIMTYNGIMAPLVSVKLSADNKFIGALDSDSTVYIFNSEGKNILKIKALYNIINPNNILNFSPDGKLIACAAPYNKVFICKTSGEILQTLSGHQANVTGVNFSPDNRFLATSSADSTVKVWYFNKNKSKFEEYIKLKGHRNIVWSARFSMNSNYILTASADSTVKIWDLNGKIIKDQSIDKILYYACASYCDAAFMSDDKVIIKTRYRFARKGDSIPPLSGQKLPEIIFDKQCSMFNMAENYPGSKDIFSSYFYSMTDPKVSGGIFSPRFDTTRKTICFKEINTNQDIEYSAYSMSDNPNNAYYSSTHDAFKIFTFSGRQQQFSKNGKYLLAITNNCLNLYPSDTAEIFRLVIKEKIFGKLKTRPVYYKKWYEPK
jgi:WD40 repeat protein